MNKVCIGVLLGVLCLLYAATATALPSPTFTGLPANGNGSPNNYPTSGWAINSSGLAVGYGTVRTSGMDPGHNHGWVYSAGTMTDINGYGVDGLATIQEQCFGINDSGTMIGVALDQAPGINQNHAFVTNGGEMNDLNAGDATVLQSRAYGINSSGTVVGQGYYTTNVWQACIYNYSGTYNAGVYSGGTWSCTSINSTLGGGCSNAMAVNDAGAVVGTFSTTASLSYYSYPHAYVRSAAGAVTDLGVPDGMDASWGTGINAQGDAIGYAYLTSTYSSGNAFIATQASGHALSLLDMPSGYTASQPFSINKYDMVAGYATDGANNRAFLWTTGVVPFYGLTTGVNDLNALVASLPAASGWVLNNARSINDAGQIIGSGHHNGTDDAHAFPYILSLPKAIGGDANLDGKVDINDLSLVLTDYDKSTGMNWATGDFTGDGKVDINDLSLVLTNYDKTASMAPSISLATVPEPSAMVLAALGFAGLASYVWRKRK